MGDARGGRQRSASRCGAGLDPFAWQTNPWVLNAHHGRDLGRAPRRSRCGGEPSTIALAHFAATTQGLQLLDARPRRTEYLLVALALFQVVLAANLTDSVFFTPLLIAFVFAAVWTLIVHTLRSEALEAGQPRELPRAFTPGLARTTLRSRRASRWLLAMVLFVALPRLRSNVVRGPGRSAARSPRRGLLGARRARRARAGSAATRAS